MNEDLIDKIVSEVLSEFEQDIMTEGIDVDMRSVTMTDRHEKLVDTSASNIPSVLTDIVPNVMVWSVFKRKSGEWGDGNPLVYALKNEKRYKLMNRRAVFSRIEYIVNKFFQQNSGVDVTIAVPSTNQLNNLFASIVARNCTNPKYIKNLFIKMTTEEVADCVYQIGSLFRRKYGNLFGQKYEALKRDMGDMPYDTFQFHKVRDMEMRKVIEKTIKLSDEVFGEYVDAINGKNVLIIDDSMTLGQTIKEACKIISSAYTPKTITVLTLFSPLYDENGDELQNQ